MNNISTTLIIVMENILVFGNKDILVFNTL